MDAFDVGIDGYNLALPNGTGVAAYGFALARLLAAAGHRTTGVYGLDAGRDPALAEVLFFEALGAGRAAPRGAAAEARLELAALRAARGVDLREVPLTGLVDTAALAERLPPFSRMVTAPRLFALAHRRFRRTGRFVSLRMPAPPAIMHWTYPLPVEIAGSRNVYTLHDLVPLRLPFTTINDKRSYDRLVRACVARAAHVCTVSEASRDDIVSLLGADPARVTNTYQIAPMAPDATARPADEDARAVQGIFGVLPQGYFLHFGAVEPKKNLGRLLEAYLSLDTATPLVLVGTRGWQSERELMLLGGDPPALDRRRLDGRVIHLEHLPRALLTKLIRSAKAVAFPSIAEGFGLPALEAMQLGTPLLASAAGGLGEVAGDAALLVDPYDVGAIAAGLRALDEDSALRARLAAAGLRRAARFSPAAYLASVEAMYDAVMRGVPPRGPSA